MQGAPLPDGHRRRKDLRDRLDRMVSTPKGKVPTMATRNKFAPMAIPPSKVSQLRRPRDDDREHGTKPVSGLVPSDTTPVVSNRSDTTVNPRFHLSSEKLHIALVVPDLKTYHTLRGSSWIIKPSEWEVDIKVHVLLSGDRTDQELVFGFALTELGLTDPQTARLQWPENIELGWDDDTT